MREGEGNWQGANWRKARMRASTVPIHIHQDFTSDEFILLLLQINSIARFLLMNMVVMILFKNHFLFLKK